MANILVHARLTGATAYNICSAFYLVVREGRSRNLDEDIVTIMLTIAAGTIPTEWLSTWRQGDELSAERRLMAMFTNITL